MGAAIRMPDVLVDRGVSVKCGVCSGNRLEFAGWMGPTPEAPFPRPCPRCGTDLTPREIQVAQTEWLLSNQDDPRVQQILARTAVHDAKTYGKVLRLGWKGASGGGHTMALLAEADLVIDGEGKVLKDRYGTEGYKLSDTELRRIRADCETYEEIPF